MDDTSPTARALLVLEMVQNQPGIGAAQLAARLGLSDRAVRRNVAVLREAGIPVESTRGRYGGYRVGRGLRVPPLMFTATEALALVMAVLEGHDAADPEDPVGSALGKIVRVLPEPLAKPVDAIRRVTARGWDVGVPDVETTAALVQASAAHRRVRLSYRLGQDRERDMDVDPWAVVVRHRRWYLLGWSHTKGAMRVLRVDRVARVGVLPETFAAAGGPGPGGHPRGAPVAGLALCRRGRDRGPSTRRGALAAPVLRQARGDGGPAYPPGRDHRRARVVRRPARRAARTTSASSTHPRSEPRWTCWLGGCARPPVPKNAIVVPTARSPFRATI